MQAAVPLGKSLIHAAQPSSSRSHTHTKWKYNEARRSLALFLLRIKRNIIELSEYINIIVHQRQMATALRPTAHRLQGIHLIFPSDYRPIFMANKIFRTEIITMAKHELTQKSIGSTLRSLSFYLFLYFYLYSSSALHEPWKPHSLSVHII